MLIEKIIRQNNKRKKIIFYVSIPNLNFNCQKNNVLQLKATPKLDPTCGCGFKPKTYFSKKYFYIFL